MIGRRLYYWHIRYWLWRMRNLSTPYEQYYADVVGRKLRRHGDHPAIGAQAQAIRTSTELLDIMRRHGMQPHHRFVDYGCGSLRLGKAVVDFLEPGKFRGMDVTQQFLDLGIDFIGADVNAAKRPALAVITSENLATAKASEPDFIASWHVCSKIPDGELDRYFGSILGLMDRTTQTFIQFPQTLRRRRMNSLNWTFSRAEFTAIVNRLAPGVKVDFITIVEENSLGVTESYAHLYYEPLAETGQDREATAAGKLHGPAAAQ
ncbi:MAG TPA: hypothetical protein VM659_01500 [Dongiaceae bacterium]|nr:hypothetical protein [Dongiaceae bacterium]